MYSSSKPPNGNPKKSETHLEASGAPVNKLDGAALLDGSNGCVDILRHNITTVQQAACHVLAVAGITRNHLVGWLKASSSDV